MKRLSPILLSAAWLSAFLAFSLAPASAQDKYPSRPVKVIVPYAPGGATDIVARIVGDAFQKVTGQGFIVLNKPGAFGMIAIDEMVKSEPDGYTLMVGNVSTNAITPIIYAKKMNSDYQKTVVAVTNLVDVPAFLLVTTANDFPPKTVAEFIDYAKKNPGKIRYGTVGIGSYPHYDMAYFAKRAGDLDLIALPNKNGASGVIQDMLRGDVQAAFLNVASSAGMVKSDKFRPLAVVNHARLPDYPNIPSMKEVGFADVGTIAWNGLFAPAATPKPVLEAIFKAVNTALKSPELIEKLKKQNFDIAPNKSLADAQAWLGNEMKHWQTITSAVKIEAAQ
jgi:tripartite-type tricarboxylate transporter receptor subunit TctC